ncbi:MAG: mannosyltransferase family protein [Anaerolineae bacterium]
MRRIIFLWLAWALILVGFQQVVTARFQPQRPDEVLFWTSSETGVDSQNDQIYLVEPFLNEHVSWDSEFYLSIAVTGYDDPEVRVAERGDETFSLNYAFFPFYPFVIRVVSWPLRVFGLTPIATATLAGILVSLLGTLVGMVALYDLAHSELGEDGAMRAVFYMLIFPTGFFLAQVYTEGLFVGLAFSSLALMRRGKQGSRYMWAAAALAACALLTRAVGVALSVALFVRMLADEPEGYRFTFCPTPWGAIGRGALYAAVPIVTYILWSFSSLGTGFRFVEENFFGRGALMILPSLYGLELGLRALFGLDSFWVGAPSQSAVYFAIEFFTIGLGMIACIRTFKHHPEAASFGLLAWIIAVFSGAPQSLARYMLVLPSIYVLLSRKGQNPIFDRAWTIASLLLMGLECALFSFDFWVA